jgi:DNA-binding response OmpR family regulator
MSARPIILAEDNDTLRRMYADMLESAGFSVMKVADGEKAIGMLHKVSNPQLIILDVMMPRLDGIETCARIRKMQGLHPSPILFLSALDNPDTILECLQAGGDDYLVKSAPMTEILERVQFWTRKGSSDEGSERRKKAIRELRALSEECSGADAVQVVEEITAEQATVNELASFIGTHSAGFAEEEPTIFRFGYVVGLVHACVRQDLQNEGRFNRFLRNLVYKTNLVDRQEIDAMLDNYERIVSQSQFQKGWMRGRDDAPKVGLDALGEQPA